MKTFRKHWLAVCATLLAFVMCFSVILGNHTRRVFTVADSSVSDGDDEDDEYVEVGERGVDYFLPEDEVEEAVRTDLVNKIFPEGEIGVEENLVPGPEFQNCPTDDDFMVACTTRTLALGSDELFIECEFNTVDMLFRCSLELGSETENFETAAYVNSDGSLGANLEINGAENPYSVSNYTHSTAELNTILQQIDEFDGSYDTESLSSISSTVAQPMGWISKLFKLMPKIIVIVVVVYVIVAETAEQIRAEINYTENQKRDSKITLGTYITNQSDSICADYDFGFAKFKDVGCAPASAYNLKIALGYPEMLSDVIYKFEKWGIEFSIGWGHMGSSPYDMNRFFLMEHIKYSKYVNGFKYKLAANNKKKEYFVMARWNDQFQGAHTFYVHKDITQSQPFYGYNSHSKNGTSNGNTIQDFYGASFIVGYVIHV